jgi:hypothetical protein
MPLSPNDMERLITAINRNTAAQLTSAAMASQAGKSALKPQAALMGAVSQTFAEFLAEIRALHEA